MSHAPLPDSQPSHVVSLPSPLERPSGRRAQQRADTRERLFQAALAEFRSVGVPSAQIDRIAKAAKVVRGTFYFHFPTKDHVLLELKDRVEHASLARVEELDPATSTLEETFRCVVDGIVQAVALTGGGELLREMLSLYLRKPFAAELDENDDDNARLTEVVMLHVEAGQRRGEVRSDLSPEQIASMFLTSTFGFIANYEGEELANVLGSLVDIVMQGLRSRG